MIDIILKWTLYALIILTVFSALTSLYGLYELNLGTCRNGCDKARTFSAYTYVGLVGMLGFAVSAFAAWFIRKSLRR